jgi:nickel/cobalt exporter
VNGNAVQVLDTAPARTRMRELAAMGAAGGIIPCPEALGVLILAAGLNRTALGLAMIVAFSAGLAAVLIALGLALVTARDRITAARPPADSPLLTRLPLLSAALVTILGVIMTATGLLDLPWPR